MSSHRSIRCATLTAAVLALAGCTTVVPGTAVVPGGATLRVVIRELPPGVSGRVRVSGPGLDRTVTGDTDLPGTRPGLYTVRVEPVAVPEAATRHAPRPEFTVQVGGRETVEAVAAYSVLVPDTTQVLDAANLGLLGDADGPVLSFSPTAPAAGDLAAGQVLVVGVGPATPQGLLRKVVEVRRAPDRVDVLTDPATLEEAAPEGELQATDQPVGSTTQPLHNWTAGQPVNQDKIEFKLSFGGPQGEQGPTGGCGAAAIGSLDLLLRPRLELGWRWKRFAGVPTSVEYARVGIRFPHGVSGNFEPGGELFCEYLVTAPPVPHRLLPFTIPLGPIPVVVVPQIDLLAKFKAALKTSAKIDFGKQESVVVGAEYREGRIHPLSRDHHGDDGKQTKGHPLAVAGETSAKGGLRVRLLFYGLTGPSVTLTTGLRAKLSTDEPFAACAGLYGDIGWQITPTIALEAPEVVKHEFQIAPDIADSCPFGTDPEPRLVRPEPPKPTLRDYQHLVGHWRYDPGPGRYETLVVHPDGRVVFDDVFSDWLRPDDTWHDHCEGTLAFDQVGRLIADMSQGPGGILLSCVLLHNNEPLTLLPAGPDIFGDHQRARLSWGVHAYLRVW